MGNWDNILTDYIKVEKNQTYINNFGFTYVWTFDENKKFIKLIGGYNNQSPKNVENAVYAIFGRSVAKTSIDGIDKANIQIERSTTLTSYIEHKSHKTEILLNEPLRSLPNAICDEIVDNKLIRRVGKVTLTGEEGWWSNWTNASFFEWFSNLRITNWKPISDNITWCSNKLKSTTSYSIEQQGQFNCFCFLL